MNNQTLNEENLKNPALEGNSFVTTDMPDPEESRKQLARKRIFYVALGLIVVVLGLITWEIIDLAL